MNLDPIQELSDELFCTQFELQTLAGSLLRGGLERWVPGFTSPSTDEHHEKRYRWACGFVAGKRVLDMACGTGRGSFLLASVGEAASVLGVDIDAGAVRYAGIRHAHETVAYRVGDAQAFQSDTKFDVVVGFETIEHLPDVPAYLSCVSSVLEAGGTFYVSSPISRKVLDTNPDNPFHVQEWGLEAFAEELSKVFRIDGRFLQLRQPPKTLLMNVFPARGASGFRKWEPVDIETLPGAKSAGVKLKGLQILRCVKKA